jgi:hypothetical protein
MKIGVVSLSRLNNLVDSELLFGMNSSTSSRDG